MGVQKTSFSCGVILGQASVSSPILYNKYQKHNRQYCALLQYANEFFYNYAEIEINLVTNQYIESQVHWPPKQAQSHWPNY